jgi:hypothetical protein
MATARLLSTSGLAALMLVASAGPGRAQDADAPLRVSTRSYQGRVLDGKTGQPLPSVAVIILWQRFDDGRPPMRSLVTAREVFTDEKGRFVHDVAALEERFPAGTFAPRIVIFRPGYTSVPETPQRVPPGVAASRFTGPDAEVRLTPLTDYEDRAEAFNVFVAILNSAHVLGATELPETFELIRFELQSLGGRPPKPAPPAGGR